MVYVGTGPEDARCHVKRYAEQYRAAVEQHSQWRETLAAALAQAQKDGATIQDLMDWTGYSRRRVFQLLREGKDKG